MTTRLSLVNEEEHFDEETSGLSGEEGSPKPNNKVGTPFYLAPELWEGKACTKKSDIWSLGVIIYELCTLKYPYFASNMEDLEAKVIKEKYTPIPQTVSKCFSTLIQRCL